MGYKILEGIRLEDEVYKIVSLRKEDLFQIKTWRNEQMSVLRQQACLTDEDQLYYYQQIVKPTFCQDTPPMILMSYLKDRNCIGYGGLVYIDWVCKRAEVSFLLNTQYIFDALVYRSAFEVYLRLIKQLAFEHLKLNRLFTETFEGRPSHEAVLESSGFKPEGCLRQHVYKDGTFLNSNIHGILKEDVVVMS